MMRGPGERSDPLEPISAQAPLDVDHPAALENAREHQIGMRSHIDLRDIDIGEEPSQRLRKTSSRRLFP